ncbi:MAG: AAA family ATPase [Gemmatimonadetes bacterium]|nr:AAA family ATPase [Gemmatimonadota bacterium]
MEANIKLADDAELADRLRAAGESVRSELKKVIIGQEDVVEQVLISLFAGGNSLIVGVPGLAKTLLIAALSEVLDLSFNRIQFTPDLMPSDITGTDIIQEDPETGRRKLAFVEGPLFANVVLADEINRTPPKTQAALLEAMQEKQVTIQGRTYDLPNPFFVLATQNPIELEGTYPLPEAQLDRFMFHIDIDYLPEDEELEVVQKTTAIQGEPPGAVLSADEILAFQELVRKVPMSEPVARHAVQLARRTRPGRDDAPDYVKEYVAYGASVRAAQYLVLGGKARALLRGEVNVSFEDVRALCPPVFRHRVLTNFHAESERVTSDDLVQKLLADVKPPASGM